MYSHVCHKWLKISASRILALFVNKILVKSLLPNVQTNVNYSNASFLKSRRVLRKDNQAVGFCVYLYYKHS